MKATHPHNVLQRTPHAVDVPRIWVEALHTIWRDLNRGGEGDRRLNARSQCELPRGIEVDDIYPVLDELLVVGDGPLGPPLTNFPYARPV